MVFGLLSLGRVTQSLGLEHLNLDDKCGVNVDIQTHRHTVDTQSLQVVVTGGRCVSEEYRYHSHHLRSYHLATCAR